MKLIFVSIIIHVTDRTEIFPKLSFTVYTKICCLSKQKNKMITLVMTPLHTSCLVEQLRQTTSFTWNLLILWWGNSFSSWQNRQS